MRQTVVGLFDGQQSARAAMAALATARIDPRRVHASEMPAPAPVSTLAPGPRAGSAPADDGVLGHIRHFFAEMFDVDHDLTPYANAVRRGGLFVRVDVDVDDQPQAVRAELALVKAGAVDITRRTLA